MVDFNKLINKKEKSKEEIARERLSKYSGNSGWIVGAVWSGIALVWELLLILAGEKVSTKITSGIVSIFLLALTIFFAINYFKRKNALESILEAFLAGERNISNIAISVGLNNNNTANLIKNMISKGIIIDAYLDKLNNKIIDKQKTVGSSENIGKTVICAGCGAKNTLTGKFGQICEYCGSAIGEEMINEK